MLSFSRIWKETSKYGNTLENTSNGAEEHGENSLVQK